jgi:hypothetical protein
MTISITDNSATIGSTEYSLPNNSTTLTPQTDDGIYQVFIDCTNLTATEQYELKIKEKATSSGTQRNIIKETITGPVSPDGAVVSGSFIFGHGWDITLKKLQGTDRSISWSIRRVF